MYRTKISNIARGKSRGRPAPYKNVTKTIFKIAEYL